MKKGRKQQEKYEEVRFEEQENGEIKNVKWKNCKKFLNKKARNKTEAEEMDEDRSVGWKERKWTVAVISLCFNFLLTSQTV
jgi:hypothetical protein